jgi:endonuclease YncB( thermonuclease family)
VNRRRLRQVNPFRDVPATMAQWRTIRRGWLKVVLFVAVVALVVGIPYVIASESLRRPPLDERVSTLTPPPGVTIDDLQPARVERIVDGDTIDVTIAGRLWRVRYFGVDTPERGDRCFREATDRNTQLIGESVLLLPDVRDEDDLGRLLRYVFLADGTSVDATLVAEGFGYAWTSDGRYRDEIIALEDGAEAEGRGCLWK